MSPSTLAIPHRPGKLWAAAGASECPNDEEHGMCKYN